MDFENVYQINVNNYTEEKNGLTYLSWAYAWREFKKIYPNATYNIKKFGENNLPYIYDKKVGYMVFTEVTVDDLTYEMWLPVMDNNNKSMKSEPYTIQVKEYQFGKWTGKYVDRTVEAADMFDVNKTIMRCLVKNLAMFGLGLYIYAGEDLPKGASDVISTKLVEALTDEIRKKKYTKKYVEDILKKYNIKKLEEIKLDDYMDIKKELDI